MKHLISIITLVFIFVISYSTSTAQSEGIVPDSLESVVLKDIFVSLGGDNWTIATNWPSITAWPDTATAEYMNTWHGLTFKDGDLVTIGLINNNLIGYLPSTIGELTQLTRLNLRENKIQGSIPTEYFMISNIWEIDLRVNEISGTIPEVHSFDKLEKLLLGNNLLSGTIPHSLCNIPTLQKLEIGANDLTGSIPECIGDLTELNELHLSNNHLEGSIPESAGNLTKLINITLNNNDLSGQVPASFDSLKSLRSLRLNNLPKLKGHIPDGIALSPGLKDLKISHTLISYIPVLKYHPNAPSLTVDVRNCALSPAEIEKNLTSPNTDPFFNYSYNSQKYNGPKALAFDAGDSLEIFSYEPGVHGYVSWEKKNPTLDIWENVDHLNISTNPTAFYIPGFSEVNKGNYRFVINNSWISVNYVSPSIRIMEDQGVLYAVNSGNWNDPEIWSFEQDGPAVQLTPTAEKSVTISGNSVVAEGSVECSDLILIPDSSKETRLLINGNLKTRAINIFENSTYPYPCEMDIVYPGKIEVNKNEDNTQ